MTGELCRRLNVYHDVAIRSAAINMAIDEALLEHATVPSIRFYGWHPPALSFGYFGKFADVTKYAITRDLVRRWTGGGIVFHGDDLTYSIVFPANDIAFNESSMSIYEKVHRALCDALGGGVKGAVVAGCVDPGRNSIARQAIASAGGYDCFANPVRADVMLNGRKIAGAAQRRTRRGLLQQGSIQGLDLENGLAERFAAELSNNCEPQSIPRAVECRAREIAAQKYGAEAWSRKR
jgi:lipoate-protein ligase A